MRRKRIILGSVAIVIIAGATAFFTSKAGVSAPQWLTLNVSRGNLDVVVTATGTLAADTTVQVGTQVSGTISRLYVDWNSRVRAGETIARLDTTFLWVGVEQAQANLMKAKVEADEAKINLDRVKQLYDRNLDSQSDYDTSLSSYQSAQADVKLEQTALKQANINLSYATIKAPIGGIVISRNVDIGETVASSYSTPTLFSIANSLSRMQVQALVDEGDVGNVRIGQSATFTVDAYPNDVFYGKVAQIRLQPTVVNNVVEYTVIIDVPNPEIKLLPGMTANLTIQVAESKDVLKVPTTALRFTPPSAYMGELTSVIPDSIRQKLQKISRSRGVAGGYGQGGQQSLASRELTPGTYFPIWILDGKEIKPVRVKIGLSDGTDTQVEGNLTAGESVVVGMLSN